MAGKIVLDTLEHSTAGSVTTDYVVNGSAKSWANITGINTISLDNSLNVSTLTDEGTGNYKWAFTSSMADTNSSFIGQTETRSGSTVGVFGIHSISANQADDAILTGSVECRIVKPTGEGVADRNPVCMVVHGDLA